MWHILYDASSAMDIGTLFQARNFLNARTVPASPMKDVNACEELLMKYLEALTITAFRTFLTTTDLCIIDTKDDQKNQKNMETILDSFVDTYIIPEVLNVSIYYTLFV